jgi:osomolarity two-component system sensor histidine kinase SLN1
MMIPHSSSTWPRSPSSEAFSYNATATTSSTRWTSGDASMSSPSPRRELGEKKPFESLAHRWSCSVSIDGHHSDRESTVLPPPAVAVSGACNRPKKTIRIDGGRGFRDHWARLRRRLGAGTSPSTSSLVDDSAAGSNAGLRGDAQGESQYGEDTEVDEVVVDRNWSDEIKSSVSLSEQNTSPGGHHPVAGPSTDRDSVAPRMGGFWGLCVPLTILRWRLFPAILDFFSPKFHNQKSELHYVKENWFMRKVRRMSHVVFTLILKPCSPWQPLALWSSLFLIINWAVNTALIPGPVLLIDKIFAYGVCNAGHIPWEWHSLRSRYPRLPLQVPFRS